MVKSRKILGAQTSAISKFRNGQMQSVQDDLAIEKPLLIKLQTPDGAIEDLVITMQTPIATQELVIGFLYTEGTIDNASDIISISVTEDEALVQLATAPKRKSERNTISSAACGMCGKTSLDAINLVRQFDLIAYDMSIGLENLLSINKQVIEKQSLFASTGGIHGAAHFDKNGSIISVSEDIGRHNAVDKAIGTMLKEGLRPEDLGLFVSGRAGFELVQKCLVSGISVMVAVGAPSSLAVDYAVVYGLTLVGFMAEDRFNIYSHQERVKLKKS